MKKIVLFIFLLFFTTLVVSAQAFVQYGIATYYADAFSGRKTTSGEHFNQKKYTCAHYSLPMQTYVKVTNLKNNKSVVVKVNDRHARKKTVVIDLSKTAAMEIGLTTSGVANVKIETVDSLNIKLAERIKEVALKSRKTKPPKKYLTVKNTDVSKKINLQTKKELIKNVSETPKKTGVKDTILKEEIKKIDTNKKIITTGKSYYVRVSTVGCFDNAQNLATTLAKQHGCEFFVTPEKSIPSKIRKVYSGPFASREQAQTCMDKVITKYKDSYILCW